MPADTCQIQVTREGVKGKCGATATDKITVKDRVMGACEVDVCHPHYLKHNKRAAELRVSRSSKS